MSERALGSCFGYAVRSQLPFHFLRTGNGDPLEISVHPEDGADPQGRLVRRWNQDGNERFFARLFDDGRRYRLSIEGEGTFIVDTSGPRISVPIDGNRVKREERLWGIPALLCFLARGDLPLHAAAIEIEGEAVLLAAPGTFGKTTLAAGCTRAGYRLLAEDLTCLRLLPRAEVIPGPAMLRVRRDVAEQLEIPFAERLEAGDDRLHLALSADRRGDGGPVPVRAVVFLHSRHDALELVRAEQGQVVRDLFALSFRLPGKDEASRAFTGVVDLVANVRAWNFFYPHRLEDLDRAVEKIATHV
jgi:hypothetical protein